MTWKERRTITVLASILAILFAVLLIVLGIRYRASRPSFADSGSGPAPTGGGATAAVTGYTSLRYSNGASTLSFERDEEGNWIWADGPDFPLDPLTVTAIVDELSNLKFQQTLPVTESLESYGLDDPSVSLTATDAQGVTRSIVFGKATTDGDSYYIQMNGDESTLYIIADTLYQFMQTPIYDMCTLPEIPALSQGNLISLTLQGPVPETDSSEEGEEPEPLHTLLTFRQSGEEGGLWFHGNNNVSGNAQVQDLVSDLTGMHLRKCVDFYPSAEAAEICGFERPEAELTATYGSLGSEQSFTLTVGSPLPDGSGRYVRLNGEDPIYLLDAEYLDPLVSLAAAGLTGS